MVILIAGSSRTGTTMLGRLLQKTGETHLVPELHFFDEIFTRSPSAPISFGALQAKLPRLLSRARSSYYDPQEVTSPLRDEATKLAQLWQGEAPKDIFFKFLNYEKKRAGAKSICEQTPRNIEFLDEIRTSKYFNGCKMILTIRGPDAVVTSQKYRYLRNRLGGENIGYWTTLRTQYAFNVIAMALAWSRSVKLVDKFCRADNAYLFRYEDFLMQKKEVTKALLTFCNIGPERQGVSVPYAGSSMVQDGAHDKHSSGTRSLTRSERAVVSFLCGGSAARFDYCLEKANLHYTSYAMARHSIGFLVSLCVRFDMVLMYLRKALQSDLNKESRGS